MASLWQLAKIAETLTARHVEGLKTKNPLLI